jgi:hypothetical protein
VQLQNGLTEGTTGTQHVGVGSGKWALFYGNPRWMKDLTYAIDPGIARKVDIVKSSGILVWSKDFVISHPLVVQAGVESG